MTGFVELDGRRLEALDIPGREPGAAPILLLHEGMGSVSMWRDFPYQLAAVTGARIVAYSRLGFGKSSSRRDPYTVRFVHEEAGGIVPRLRTALGLERPILFGHSTGGSIALAHAAHDPAGVAGVIAMAPLVDVEESNLASIREARRIFETTGWRQKLARHHDHPIEGVFRSWNDTWLAPFFREWTLVPELPAIRCPVLAIGGLDDPYSSPRQLDLIREHATAARVEVVKLADCGHVPHRDQPQQLFEAVAAFAARCR